ncbi:MAG TPA: clan AA aspartic protease [Phycisphaerae bacterium]|jgi:predicted aspartyl protease
MIPLTDESKVASEEPAMGRFSVEVELANNHDLELAAAGHLPAGQVRTLRVLGLVDSGAARLVIPQAICDQLGLVPTRQTRVTYADKHSAQRPLVDSVYLTYLDRGGVFSAIVEPARDTALIGTIVLEELDLVVDCTQQRLVPRDPKQIISEIE